MADAEEWGHLKGQIVVTGDLPQPPLISKKGDPQIKDAAVCGVMDIPDESLVVDPTSRGLSYAFIYLKDPPSRVHPDGRDPPADDPVMSVQGCRYFPRSLVVRAGKTLQVQLQQGEVAHNPHFFSFTNSVGCTLLNDVHRFEFRYPDRIPLPLKCDIHPWMRATLLVVDHPYAAVTDHQGRFTMKNLPTGEQTFRVWHERPGYLVREWKVTIAADKTLEAPIIEVLADRFDDRRPPSPGPPVTPAGTTGLPAATTAVPSADSK